MKSLMTIIIMLFLTQALLLSAGFHVGSTTVYNTFNFFSQVLNGEPITMFECDSSNNCTSNLNILSTIFNVFAFVGIGAIIVGFFVTSNRESFILGGLALLFLRFVADFIPLMQYVHGKGMDAATGSTGILNPIAYLIILLYAVLIIAMFFAAISWWRGND